MPGYRRDTITVGVFGGTHLVLRDTCKHTIVFKSKSCIVYSMGDVSNLLEILPHEK